MKQPISHQRPTVISKQDKNFEDDIPSIKDDFEKDIMRIVDENIDCDEIKLQFQEHKVTKLIATETISVRENPNIERICRQYVNQDVLIKIRNGKKVSIERTKIIRSH